MARGEYVPAMDYTLAYTRMGDKEQAFAWMAKAGRERNALIYAARTDPIYDPLRTDRRLAAILNRI